MTLEFLFRATITDPVDSYGLQFNEKSTLKLM